MEEFLEDNGIRSFIQLMHYMLNNPVDKLKRSERAQSEALQNA